MSALLRCLGFLLLLGLLTERPAAATHLVGGELTYRYLDAQGSAATPYRYTISARVYFNKEIGSLLPYGNPSITIQVYSNAVGQALVQNLTIPRKSVAEITPPTVPGCPLQVPRVTLGLYETTVSLPLAAEGYTAVLTINSRNAFITNLSASVGEFMTLSVNIPPGTLPNSSPVFSNNAYSLICLGENSSIINNAYDADGDRLSYRFATPNGAAINQPVEYAAGYSPLLPFGSSGSTTIDPSTGLASYLSPTQGTFLLAVDVDEFRTVNGREVLLSTLRRDIQVVVRVCAGGPNSPPAFTAPTLAQRDYQLEEGQTLAFTVAAADPDPQSLTMTVGSVLLDGPGRVDATVNGQPGLGTSSVGTVQVRGLSAVTGDFRLVAGCGLARPSPYDVIVTVTDNACNQKTIATVFRITVTKPAAPARIRGDSVLCAQATATYSTPINPLYVRYRWSVQGGEVLGTNTGPAVRVQWNASGLRTVSVRGISATGCPTDSVTRTVNVLPGPALSGPTVYCRTANTGLRYTVAGPLAVYQWTVADGTLVSGQGTNNAAIDITAGNTATVTVAPATGCATTLRVSLDTSCLYFYNIITPNGDGRNDMFVVENLQSHPNTAMTIFNRWGRQVFHADDYHNNYAGDAPGVFYYLCQLADGTHYKGWFEVVR